MTLEPAKLLDGRVTHYKSDPLGEGSMKTVYALADGRSVVGYYKNKALTEDTFRLTRLQAVLGHYNPTLDAVGGVFWQQVFCWPTSIVAEPSLGIITPIFPENFYFSAGRFAGKEKQGTWFSRPRLREMLPREELGPWSNYLRVGLQLARGIRRLHQSGLAHADLSPRNVLIDPTAGRALIIDIDSLVVPDLHPPEILGTPGYIAPEVLATMDLPLSHPDRRNVSTTTDQHALAVLIYEYLLARHPLRGPKVRSAESAERDEFLSMGPEALYVEHPTDDSNRPSDIGVPVSALGPQLKDLFERAFVDGIAAPEDRPAAIEWERGLVRTWDRLITCSNSACDRGAFILVDEARPICPFCGTSAEQAVVLGLASARRGGQFREDGVLALAHRQGVFVWHTGTGNFPAEHANQSALAHVIYQNGWKLVNDALETLAVIDGDSLRPVQVGRPISLEAGMKLRLGPAPDGRIAEVRFAGNKPPVSGVNQG